MGEQSYSGSRPIYSVIPIFLILLLLLFISDNNFSTLFSYFSTSNNVTAPSNGTDRNIDDVGRFQTQKITNNSVDRIEEDLGRARAAIREAVRTRSYRSYKEEPFIPRGPVYRNPYAFHQSHIEMVKRFKIWTYREGERPLVHRAPMNNIYSIEGQFLDEMESGISQFRADSPEEAHMFYLPFSVASIIHFIYQPILSKKDYNRDRLQRIVADYIDVVADKYPFWNRSRGADHFMVSCHDWAPDISKGNPKLYSEFIRVLCNANTSEGFEPSRDASLPEIYLEYESLAPRHIGQDPVNRTILAFFAGRVHGYIRRMLFEQWEEKDKEVQVFTKLPSREIYTNKMGRSKFCLCPSGYEVASPRIVEAINQGCVPVLISANYSLPFRDVLDWDKFTVEIPVEKIGDIKKVLEGISEERYLEMYHRVRSVGRHFIVNRPAKPYDLLHMILHSLWLRRLNVKLL